MTPYIGWRANGVSLPKVARVSTFRPPVSTRRTPVEIAGRHGVITTGLPTFGEPAVTIIIESTAGSQAQVEAAVAQVQALLAQPTITLTRIAGGIEASASADLVSIAPGRHTPHMWAELTAVLAIPGVFFRAAAATGTPLGFSADLADVALPHLQGSSGPIPDAVARLKGPHSGTVTVTDSATGTGLIQASAALTAAQYLYMDAARLRSWISSSAGQWTPGGTDVSQNLDYPAAGILQLWPRVEPAVGDPSIELASAPMVRLNAVGGSGRTADTTLAVRAARSYL